MKRDRIVFDRAFAVMALFLTLFSLQPFSSVKAQADGAGWYVGANIPLMFIDDTVSTAGGENLLPVRVAYEATALNEYDTGYKLGGSFGYAFESGLRIEVEAYHASAEVSKLTYSQVIVPAHQLRVAGQHRTSRQWGGYANRGPGQCLVRLRYRRPVDAVYRRGIWPACGRFRRR